ncbi:MAG: hypothetical protein PHS09_03750 [Candidatus Omnitrophica bacterium]|jgi:uncharacterized protein (UPF0333 family)|nr:hypothetical protein [Candidatus Omnitrophota bacterium]MDD5512861.1 hypothetical protein [Candidatus Omnitrophota bacterium]
MKKFSRCRGQSFLEYAMLLVVVTIAIMAMFPYMRRAVNSRLKHIQMEMNEWRR